MGVLWPCPKSGARSSKVHISRRNMPQKADKARPEPRNAVLFCPNLGRIRPANAWNKPVRTPCRATASKGNSVCSCFMKPQSKTVKASERWGGGVFASRIMTPSLRLICRGQLFNAEFWCSVLVNLKLNSSVNMFHRMQMLPHMSLNDLMSMEMMWIIFFTVTGLHWTGRFLTDVSDGA